MSALSKVLSRFAEHNAQVVGISPDSIYCHLAWQEKSLGWQDFPMASDYWPHAGTAQKYGVLREGPPLPGINERTVFIVDKQGKIAYSRVYELGQTPDFAECLEALSKLE
jgi:alkyl hydroperoxide reductase subunit AhpC